MILDEEAPGGICDERGWTLDLFGSADEAPGRAAGEASAALAAQQEPDTAPVGRPLFTGAADEGYDGSNGKGETRSLLDVAGQAVLTWRSGDLKLRRVYDALRRPRALYVDEGSGERLVELTVYGDAVSDAGAGDFALGRPLQVYDTAGRVTLAYDFRGRTVAQTRQVYEDITIEADWDALDGLDTLADIEAEPVIADLSVETFTVATSYDALDRVVEQTAPDTSRTVPGYDVGGKLVTVQVYVRGALTATDVVTGIAYNARGQRESITYGNHTETTDEYNEDRFWLDRVLTNRSSDSSHGAAKLQDLNYTRDAVGHITEIVDAAHETVFFSNTQVSPTRSFTYDDLYRLIEATGREKVSQTQTTAWYSAYAGGTGVIPDSGSPALRSYTQSYEYDEAGNILEMAHVPSSGSSWTRSYQVATANNQLEATTIPSDGAAYDDAYVYNDRGAMVYMPHLKVGVDPNIARDFRDQMRKVELDSLGNVSWYAYDASGQRVRKLIVKASSTEERIYIGGYEVWRERDLSEIVQEERQTLHVMDDQRRIAMVETLTVTGGVELDEFTTPALDPRLRYQLDDHLGTALVEVDEQGGVITYEEFHPYGTTAWYAEKSGIEVSSKRYRYTGMERDEETGLQYHSARYYAPWLGRWERPDLVGIADGTNRLAYVQGNPIGGTDQSGRGTVPGPGPGPSVDEPVSFATGGDQRIETLSIGREVRPGRSGTNSISRFTYMDGSEIAPSNLPGAGWSADNGHMRPTVYGESYALQEKELTLSRWSSSAEGNPAFEERHLVLQTWTFFSADPLERAATSRLMRTMEFGANDLAGGDLSGSQHPGAVLGMAAVVPGARALSRSSRASTGAGIADDAFVVRGGVATPEQIAKGIGPHRDVPGLTGFSAQSRAGATVEELAATGGVGGGPFPHGKVSVSTVGDLRCVGCNVVPSPGGGLNHVTVTPGAATAEQISAQFTVVPNTARAP